MKGMTLKLMGVVALGLLFVGSRAEGETTAPSVPDVPNSPGGNSKVPTAGQGWGSQTQPEAIRKLGHDGHEEGGGAGQAGSSQSQPEGGQKLDGASHNYTCWKCAAIGEDCPADKGLWKKESNCYYCVLGVLRAARGDRTYRDCFHKDSPWCSQVKSINNAEFVHTSCGGDLCNEDMVFSANDSCFSTSAPSIPLVKHPVPAPAPSGLLIYDIISEFVRKMLPFMFESTAWYVLVYEPLGGKLEVLNDIHITIEE